MNKNDERTRRLTIEQLPNDQLNLPFHPPHIVPLESDHLPPDRHTRVGERKQSCRGVLLPERAEKIGLFDERQGGERGFEFGIVSVES